jgi:4-amino-4-deoxy-L-arabinose transferase-like glycosyltransferase
MPLTTVLIGKGQEERPGARSYIRRMSVARFRWALCGLVLVAIAGSVLDVMEVDAAQYAAMSRDMLHSADPTHLHFRGEDYLDKPPLLFWLSALSFQMFGIHAWSYKLPSILFAFLGVCSTFRFAHLFYGAAVARKAAIMFGGSAAFLLMTNDVRCDTILTGSVITAIWLGAAWLEQRRPLQLMGASLAVAAGLLVKGPIGAMAPLLALGAHVVLARRWSALHSPWLLVPPLIIGLALLPMCIGLYEQHGIHGLRFYFWEQSFGRITGENRWKDDSSYFYFTHEVLWQTLPWVLAVLLGLWRTVGSLIARKPLAEGASIGGILLVFIALSASHFKLPHYLYVILPLFAVQGAAAWEQGLPRWLLRAHMGLIVALSLLLLVLLVHCFPAGVLPLLAVLVAWSAAIWIGGKGADAPFVRTFWTWIVVALAVNTLLYPRVLAYQANAVAGKWAAAHGMDANGFFGMQVAGTALDYYAGFHVKWLSNAEEARAVVGPGTVIYTDAARKAELEKAGFLPKEVWALEQYEVQLLGVDLLLPELRPGALEHRYLLRF